MMNTIITTLRLCCLSIVIVAFVYVPTLLAFGGIVVPKLATGSLILGRDGQIVGSQLIAQPFTQPQYFHPRPSATNYAANASGGNNLSPTSPALTERVKNQLLTLGKDLKQPVPLDLVTTSASGLDPHITVESARYQISRIANARGIKLEVLECLINEYEPPLVNVLLLNIALEELNYRYHCNRL